MIFRFADVEIDVDVLEVRRNGTVIDLEPKVYDVLIYLIRHRDRLVPKAELFRTVWADSVVERSALSRCIYQARRLIGNRQCIKTLYGRGYRFAAPVLVVPDADRNVEHGASLQEKRLPRLSPSAAQKPTELGDREDTSVPPTDVGKVCGL